MTIVTTGPPPLNPGDLAEIKIGHESSLPVSLLFVGRALRTLWSNRKARIGLVILSVFILIALFAPVLAPYSPMSTSFQPYQSPTPTTGSAPQGTARTSTPRCCTAPGLLARGTRSGHDGHRWWR